MSRQISSLASGLVLVVLCTASAAQDLRLDADGRWQPQLADSALRTGGSLAAELAFQPYSRGRDVSQYLDLIGFARYDPELARHSHADVREATYTAATRDYEFRAGIGRAFWGVTEGAHLVDIVNQEDWLEDIDGEDKLGQPMLSAAWTENLGIWRAYLLPRFRPREFPDPAVLPLPFPIEEEGGRYASSQGRQHVDWALRWKHLVGGLDFALSWFGGTAREPRLVPCAGQGSGRPGTEREANCDLEEAFGGQEPGPAEELILDLGSGLGVTPSQEELEDEATREALEDIVLVPHYAQIRQYGLELQWITGGWAFKFEGRRRELGGGEQHAAAAGFEYTQGQPLGWPADFGYVLEYLYDDRSLAEGIAPLDNDLLIAWRALFSDVAGTQILAGVIQDLDDRGRIYSVEASRRLGGSMGLAVDLRVYSDIAPDDPLAFLSDTDRLRLSFSYYL